MYITSAVVIPLLVVPLSVTDSAILPVDVSEEFVSLEQILQGLRGRLKSVASSSNVEPEGGL